MLEKMENKVLSISIAAYNAEKDIERCLKSFLKTDVASDLELLVVNDGSADQTAAVVERYVDQYPEIVKLINKENGGHGSTINTSITQATGKYYKIVDSDDWVDGEGLSRLVHWLKEHDVDLVLNPYCEIDAVSQQCKTEVIPYRPEQKMGVIQSIDEAEGIILYMHSLVFNTSVVKQMGPVIAEHCFYVDMEYATYPLKYVSNYICFDYPIYQYLLGTATQSMNINNLIKRRGQHLKVTQNLVRFIEDNEKSLCPTVYRICLQRIRLAALNQYKIYTNMKDRGSLQEIKSFDRWLKQSAAVYPGPEGRFMMLIKLNRKTNFVFYRMMRSILQLMHKEPAL